MQAPGKKERGGKEKNSENEPAGGEEELSVKIADR